MQHEMRDTRNINRGCFPISASRDWGKPSKSAVGIASAPAGVRTEGVTMMGCGAVQSVRISSTFRRNELLAFSGPNDKQRCRYELSVKSLKTHNGHVTRAGGCAMTPCSLAQVYLRLESTCCLDL
jgi:hypothetical protein